MRRRRKMKQEAQLRNAFSTQHTTYPEAALHSIQGPAAIKSAGPLAFGYMPESREYFRQPPCRLAGPRLNFFIKDIG
jgi:hypothetical protein